MCLPVATTTSPAAATSSVMVGMGSEGECECVSGVVVVSGVTVVSGVRVPGWLVA